MHWRGKGEDRVLNCKIKAPRRKKTRGVLRISSRVANTMNKTSVPIRVGKRNGDKIGRGRSLGTLKRPDVAQGERAIERGGSRRIVQNINCAENRLV